MNILEASRHWRTRPSDERFTSLYALAQFTAYEREHCTGSSISSRKLQARPVGGDHSGLQVVGPDDDPVTPTHWSFGQLAALSGSPAGYLRRLPSELIADCLNYGLQIARNVEDIGVMLYRNDGAPTLRAATGPNYGRIWDAEVAAALVARFGDGVTGQWRVPGEFGKRVEVTKANTTLYASDRDMWVFLADEENRIEIPDRRNGEPGSFARGFFVWNSEVGARSLGAGFFLFDFACKNRIIWGARDYTEVRIRHTSGAPDRWLEQVVPVLNEYSKASTKPVAEAIARARAVHVEERLDAFLGSRFGRNIVEAIKDAHQCEEGRPIETAWDAATGATAYARTLPNQDRRIEIERAAGELLNI